MRGLIQAHQFNQIVALSNVVIDDANTVELP